MYYLTNADFETVITATQLGKLLNNPANTVAGPVLLSKAVGVAVDEAVSFITGRFDTAAAFLQTGDDRDSIMVQSLVDMALYHLYSSISPQNIPDLRQQRYQEALALFKGVGKGTRFLKLPLLVLENQSTFLLYGSNTQFRYNYTHREMKSGN